MGLFEQILGSVLSGAPGQAQTASPAMPGAGASLQQIILAMIAQQGGVQGILQKFQQAGSGGAAASWVGTGPNQQISPADLQQALDPATVDTAAQHAGISTEQMLSQLSQHLPQMIDGLSPNGQAPNTTDALLQAGLALLRNRYG